MKKYYTKRIVGPIRFIPIPSRDKWWKRLLRLLTFGRWGYSYWTPPEPERADTRVVWRGK